LQIVEVSGPAVFGMTESNHHFGDGAGAPRGISGEPMGMRKTAAPSRLRSRAILALMLLSLTGCASVPIGVPHEHSSSMGPQHETALGQLTASQSAQDSSAVRVLDRGADAFLERVALIEAAEQSIDAQYYIWNSDATGRYLALRLYAAAERGVRVRLLIDDINVAGRDAALASLDAHPNIELRIYNPFAERNGARKLVNFLYEFSRLNRRMHNKSFTVDGVVTIIGGRNIGDEYFDADPELNFRDREVLATGAVVAESAAMFDRFWNSGLSVPVATLTRERMPLPELAQWSAAAIADRRSLEELGFAIPDDAAVALGRLRESHAQLVRADASLVSDVPPQLDSAADTESLQASAAALVELAQTSGESILAETAYLVMDDPSLTLMASRHGAGVSVRILTNSMASNDVTANHAAYARRRVPMLRSGIRLHELRADAQYCSQVITRIGCSDGRLLGLHSKTVVFDGETVAIGSINLNMRSAYLNAETVMIIRSRELAQQVSSAIEAGMEDGNSWSVQLADGKPRWQTRRDGAALTMRREPDSGWWRRLRSRVVASLPLEKYL
jgi:cardiolipin synthase C